MNKFQVGSTYLKVWFTLFLGFLVPAICHASGPSISSLSPTSGAVGTSVTITGSNFGTSQGSSTVTFNGTTASVTSWGSTSIKATVPSAATTGNVVVTVGGAASNGKSFTVVPHINTLTPSSGAVGASVTIAGTTFGSTQGSSTVKFNGTAATATTWSSTSIVATVPTGATTGNVVVTVSSQASNGVSFTVLPTPSISSLSVSSGAVGASVTLTGSNLGSSQGGGSVSFNGTVATIGTWSSGSITTTVPAGATTGNVVVNASGVNTNGIAFTVLPTPSISSLSVTSGAVGAAVTISGSNFGSTQGSGTVTFNGTTATVTSWSATSIAVTVPSGATTGNVVVNASGVNTNGVAFTVLPTPSLSSLSVTSGAVGASVTITGANFGSTQGNGSIKFNGVTAGVATWGATSIAVTVPSGATTGNVVVNASGVNTNGIAFTVLPTPSISSLSVTSGLVGAPVTITGTNFGSTQGSGTVKFNGTTAAVTSWGQSSIAVTVPSGATTGNVVVNTSGVMTNGIDFTVLPTPNITGLSPVSGAIGESVTIMGTGFGASQGSSTVSLNGITVSTTSWSDIAIVAVVPSGASSGPFAVTVNGQTVYSPTFTITSLPSGWSDGDIGSVGIAGSAAYASGVFTVTGAGPGTIGVTADAFHFVYQPMSGDGTIVARVVSLQGSSSSQAGVMIRETLNSNATNAFVFYDSGYAMISERTTTGGTSANQYNGPLITLPYWVMLVRSGSTFTGYQSPDGINWTIVGSAQTISMAQSVYVGLGVDSQSSSSSSTAKFDYVSVNSTAAPAPAITSASATTASIGEQVVIGGSGFGNSQNGSLVMLNDAPVPINSWSNTSITFTVPTGATSGDLVVSVAPSMNDSNPIFLTVTTQPLPTSWLDRDIGNVGVVGSATYANGVLTVAGGGLGTFSGTTDGFHFVYQSLSGDGTIVARVSSLQGNSYPQAGVMIRETLDSAATNASVFYYSSYAMMSERTTTGASPSYQYGPSSIAPPYWLMLVRSGNSFSGYASPDGVNWTPVGTTQTINMAQNVYMGLFVSSRSTSASATGTFDNVSTSSAAIPAPVITGVSATTGSIGSQVVISGSGFGEVQGGGFVQLNGVTVTINLWSATEIQFTIPAGATSGNLVVTVAPSMNDSNPVYFAVTTQPIPVSVLDQDISATGVRGSATFANGLYTVTGAGVGTVSYATDGLHFVYQPLSGDGTIVARVVSLQGSSSSQAGIMIRETLNSNATNAFVFYSSGYPMMSERTTTGGTPSSQYNGPNLPLPCWLKLVRSGNTFTGYQSADGVSWTLVSAAQTIPMAQNVYVGLGVSSRSLSASATATFDGVSVSTASSPAPIITNISATTGPVGTQVTIIGSNFGASVNGSAVYLNDAPVTINAWSNTSITITIATGATSGFLFVSLAPNMNDSNGVVFTVTNQPLPIPWLDADIGSVGVTGSATYATGVFTVTGAGFGTIAGVPDGLHFVYQQLSGDGMIVARVDTMQGSTSQAGVMIRETLDASATNAFVCYYQGDTLMSERTTTGGTAGYQYGAPVTLPYWVKLIRQGNSFSGYASADGVNWTQVGTTQTINMAQNVYVGFASTSRSTSSAATSTFDNPAVTIGTSPFVTGISPSLGGVGTSVTVTGSNFGSSQGTSSVQFSGVPAASITSWSSTQIIAVVPASAPSGADPVSVTVGSITSPVNPIFTLIHPVITSVTPPAAEPGAQVTLNGSGFGTSYMGYYGISQAQFNGLQAAEQSWSDTKAVVTVPTTATSGTITVVNNGVSSNAIPFTILENISVTSISPTSGPAGTTVTITGTGFGPTQSSSTVDFWGTTAAIQSWSDTQIVATVPSGANTGPVDVTVGAVTWYGPWFTMTQTIQLTDSKSHQSSYTSALIGGMWVSLVGQGSGCSTCTQRGNISYTYDASGNPLSRTDENGNTTTYTYDSNGNVLTMTAPIGPGHTATTMYTYNSFGEVLTVIDPMGFETTNSYDAKGNLLRVTTPAPGNGANASVTQFGYNSLGQLTTITDPRGNATSLAYTPAGLIQTITDTQSNVTTYGYDSRGNRTSVTDANNKQTAFSYDAMNRLTKITYPDTTTTQLGYDYRGRRTSVTDQNNKGTSYAYDDADRLTSVTDAANNVTTYGYDTESNLTSIQDANHNTTYFAYDAFGRVTKTTFPSGYVETYGYDNVGNLTSKIDRKNQLITYTYDQLNRLVQKSYPDTSTVNYTYDNDSRLTQVTDPTGTYQFTFDNMGRLTGTSTQYAFLTSRTFTTSYGYDAASNRTGFTDPESGSTTYAYDTLNRLQTLTPPAAISGGNFGFGYDVLSRRTSLTRPNAVNTTYGYDNLSRLLSVTHALGGTTLDGAVYTVDNAGNRLTRTPQPSGTAATYGYDNIYELQSVTQTGSTTESYTYDPVGNRLSNLSGSGWSYNTSNELNSRPSYSYTYDANGNTATKTDSTGTTTYAWDYDNRLTSVTLPGSGGTVSYRYDPFGRRIYKSSSSGTSVYAYDNLNLVEEANSGGVAVARYTLTQNVDEPLAMLRGGATSYYEQDGLNSVTSLTDTTGAPGQTYTYDSFGNVIATTGSLANPFRYTGREFDAETSLYYYRARYYDPVAGRFLSEDEVGNDEGANLYLYVGNSPVIARDPTGFYKLKGFPPVLENLMRNAINDAINTIGANGCKDGCAGPAGPKIANALQNATYVFTPENQDDCGVTTPNIPFFHHINVTALAFSPTQCCGLASTLAHEASHYAGIAGDKDQPGSAYDIEKKCFECGTGHPPPKPPKKPKAR